MAQSKHYQFTLNNYNDNHLVFLRTAVERNPDMVYVCFGKEVGEEGTPHLQGYLQLTGGKRMRTVHSLLGFSDLHLEAALGSDEDNYDYCSKDGDFEEFGEKVPIRAKRGKGASAKGPDFQGIIDAIKAGASLRDICDKFCDLFIKYHTGIVRAHGLYQKKPFPIKNGPWKWNVDHDWESSLLLWGAPGIGKTCYAQYLLPRALFVSHMDMLKMYDPTNFEGIIFDDMSFAHLPRESQIHLLDIDQDRAIHCRHACAYIPRNTKKIFLSNLREIFINDAAVQRRLTIIHLQ